MDHGRVRFGAQFVAAQRQRFGSKPPEQRPLAYDIAVGEEYQEWRAWLDAQLALLPDREADRIAGQLWQEDKRFWPSVFELAVGAGLRAAGLDVAYERSWDGLTPDWTVFDIAGKPLCFVEVHTDQPPDATYGLLRSWRGLEERIAQIPCPVVLTLAADPDLSGPIPPPDARTAKRIARDLKNALLRLNPQIRISTCGYTFVVLADRWGRQLPSPRGLRAHFMAPSGGAGVVSAWQLVERVGEKIAKYRELAATYEVPLVVAVGAHRFTGVGLEELDDLLAGRQTITFQFNAGDPFIGEQTVQLDRPRHWRMPPELSGLLWISNQFPFALTARPNPTAQRPMPHALLNP
ncbi:hypothetical protein LI90_4286 [Carbonactinospora thermoautotrophica]|uniref:Uncharacterized protein n=1 Tax=Carbonactinospora thermoautotrophica TaxID=1469144 RepID=A0A132MZ86_9ACTN|nr:hypothetical protein [Carbonactinospora thermoautotrophica]KWX03235.1 hypothetical protein LI90_4286 [Carbonactinospora thermoautotrophica]